jgi:hypothetical protein
MAGKPHGAAKALCNRIRKKETKFPNIIQTVLAGNIVSI